MNYQEALNAALNGRCLLFLGAGYSLGATNVRGENILNSRQLALKLCEKVELDDPTDDLKAAADDYIDLTDNIDVVISELSDLLKVKTVQQYHEGIASVPWRYVYTTNYDNAYELACLNISKNYKYASLSTEITSLSTQDNAVIHLNGMIEFLDKNTIQSEFKLTNTSYITSDFMASDWYRKFIFDIESADAIFFVGYSLYDIDIKRIFVINPEFAAKTFFVLGTNLTKRDKRIISKVGSIIDKTTFDFSLDIKESYQNFTPEPVRELLTSFHETSEMSYKLKQYSISNDDIFKLFIMGGYDRNKIFYDLTSGQAPQYYIKRQELKEVIDLIKQGATKNFLVKSDFGNGKTLFIEGLKALCAQQQIKCYELRNENTETSREIDTILRKTGKQVLIIENYHRYKKSIKQILTSPRPDNTFLVLTERSVIDNIQGESTLASIYNDTYPVILDKIDKKAIDNLIDIFHKNAFWRKLAGYSKSYKRTIINRDYKSSMASLLLGLLQSEDIIKKLQDIYQELEENQLLKEISTIIFIFGVIDARCDLQDILAILNRQLGDRTAFDTNQAIKQLFNKNTYEISVKSSVFSRFILKHFGTPDYIVSVLLKIYESCAARLKTVEWCRKVTYDLHLFSNIQEILPEANKFISAIKYFDAIGSLNKNCDSYHYWLQYAILRTVYGDFQQANDYFQTAYNLYETRTRKQDGMRHRKLDNYFSRFLMRRAIESSLADSNFFDDFTTADSITQRQILDYETLHYPYRVAMLYGPFYDKYGGIMTPDQEYFFFSRVRGIKKHIDGLSTKLIYHRYVNETNYQLSRLLKNAEKKINSVPDDKTME